MKRRTLSFILGATLVLVALVPHTFADPIGRFTAEQKCQAYQSMRKKTNPQDVTIEIGRQYQVVEQNVQTRPQWYRVRIPDARPALRWVYSECGSFERSTADDSNLNSAKDSSSSRPRCSTPGLQDAFVLALSWQPAFCEGQPDRPECRVTDPDAFQANNFTLHGLWPNKGACGTAYGFCGKYDKAIRPFCRYAPVPFIDTQTLEKLGRVMPSAAHGSCLQRHQWHKHGSCQTRRNPDQYFALAIRLIDEFNTSGPARFMQVHTGRTVSARAFFDAVDAAFFQDAHKRLSISCRNGKLTDVHITLPGRLDDDTSLSDLMKKAPARFSNRCGARFEVDAPGQ